MSSKAEEKIILAISISAILGISVLFGLSRNIFPNIGHNQVEEETQTEQGSNSQTDIPDSDFVIDNPISEEPISGIEAECDKIVPEKNDYRVIPDKYNTGCKGELYKISGETLINGISIGYSNGTLCFDFYYRNKDFSGTIIFENYDFSDYPISVYHENEIEGRKINFIFRNCNFSYLGVGRLSSEVFKYDFYDCSFNRFYGSNSSFHNCYFGGSYNDGIVPFNNISVENCYFSDFASNDPKGNGAHADGTQMYGNADSMVENVLFSNCRFEIPAVQTTKSTSAVNACIMLALEFNNGKNIHFQDCILNGGGYTVYAGKNAGFTLEDVSFENIKIGDAKLFGNLYSLDEDVTFNGFDDQDALYVSSVWNDGTKTHVIVSNDTAEERILRVVTGSNITDYTIKPCLGGYALWKDNYDMPFDSFPFDIEIVLDSKADYVICFDITDGYEKQIRYVSFDGKPTYYDVKKQENQPEIVEVTPIESVDEDYSDMTPIEGYCGKDVTYYLDKSGILKIEGVGEIYSYHSRNPAPWHDYSKLIVSIEISEGITQIGSQAFTGLNRVEMVELPKSLTYIHSNAFLGCSGLKGISFYSGVNNIEVYVFHGTNLTECIYYGSRDEWNAIEIGEHNDALISCNKRYMDN